MNLHNFNFAHPAWLLALLLVPVAIFWLWYQRKISKSHNSAFDKFIDAKLLPHLLLSNSGFVSKNNIGWIYAGIYTCLILALANPRWNYQEVDAYDPTASMVILLDLSLSMNAEDIMPSRMVRARQNIEDLLNMSSGLKIGLIGFAANPHLISPVTDDVQTIKTFLPFVDSGLISKHGDNLELALNYAAELLSREPGDKKSILLVSDGNFADINYAKKLAALHKNNINVHVLGVGTLAGAAYRNQDGAIHKAHGKIILSKLRQEELKAIAKSGHGIYVEANHAGDGIQSILNKVQKVDNREHEVAGKIRQWEDRYYLFLIPAFILMLLLINSRVLMLLFCVIIVPCLYPNSAQAFEFKSLFKNSAQRGYDKYQEGSYSEAAEIFTDHYQRGVALYRAGDFSAAEEQFAQVKRGSVANAARYNSGNTQMQQSKWSSAISSYEKVLEIEPNHSDAQHNLALARKMLAENGESESKDQGQDQEHDQKKQQNQKEQKEQKEQNNSENSKKSNAQSNEAEQQQSKEEKQQQHAAQEDQESESSKRSEDKKNDRSQSNLQKINPEQEERAQQWLNRVNSDIRVFLRNKFYIEDMLGSK